MMTATKIVPAIHFGAIYSVVDLSMDGRLTHWGRDKMDAISQTTFSSAFSWMKMFDNISQKFVPKGPINNIPALVQIMASRRPGDSHYLNQWWLV